MIENDYEEAIKDLRSDPYKPKRSIVKFSELHKGMYKAYQMLHKGRIEKILEKQREIERAERNQIHELDIGEEEEMPAI